MTNEITLDQKTFKVLASDTRVSIIKSLGQRRKMLTELSKELGMSVSTIKEHLERLSEAGLVVQIDDGHKWKYYELTGIGKKVLNQGDDTKIWVLLGLSGIAIVATTFSFMSSFMPASTMQASSIADRSGSLVSEAAPKAIDTGTGFISYTPEPILHVLALVIFAAIIGISIGYLWKRKRKQGYFLGCRPLKQLH
ncbi:MAG: winged helix-turn-helix domain-containing protein [Nanoarchaeota archaeon]